MVLGRQVDRLALLAALLARCEAWYERALAGESPHAAWAARLDTVGRRVTVATTTGSVAGMAVGVTPEGALLVRDDDAAEHVIWSGDVTGPAARSCSRGQDELGASICPCYNRTILTAQGLSWTLRTRPQNLAILITVIALAVALTFAASGGALARSTFQSSIVPPPDSTATATPEPVFTPADSPTVPPVIPEASPSATFVVEATPTQVVVVEATPDRFQFPAAAHAGQSKRARAGPADAFGA